MTDNKLFCVSFSGNYSMSCGWDNGWCNAAVYPCVVEDKTAKFTVGDRDYTCKIDSDFVDRWGGYVDNLRDNAGSRSVDVYVWANNADDAKGKAHDVIMRFSPPTAYYKKESA